MNRMKFNYRMPMGQRTGAAGVRPPTQILQNIAQNRRPSFNSAGQIRGFRSVPGAASSPRNIQPSIPNSPTGGLSDSRDWGDFFQGNSPTGVRMGYRPSSPAIASAAFPSTDVSVTASDPMSDNPVPSLPNSDTSTQGNIASATPTADGYLGSVVSGAQDWMRRNFGDNYA